MKAVSPLLRWPTTTTLSVSSCVFLASLVLCFPTMAGDQPKAKRDDDQHAARATLRQPPGVLRGEANSPGRSLSGPTGGVRSPALPSLAQPTGTTSAAVPPPSAPKLPSAQSPSREPGASGLPRLSQRAVTPPAGETGASATQAPRLPIGPLQNPPDAHRSVAPARPPQSPAAKLNLQPQQPATHPTKPDPEPPQRSLPALRPGPTQPPLPPAAVGGNGGLLGRGATSVNGSPGQIKVPDTSRLPSVPGGSQAPSPVAPGQPLAKPMAKQPGQTPPGKTTEPPLAAPSLTLPDRKPPAPRASTPAESTPAPPMAASPDAALPSAPAPSTASASNPSPSNVSPTGGSPSRLPSPRTPPLPFTPKAPDTVGAEPRPAPRRIEAGLAEPPKSPGVSKPPLPRIGDSLPRSKPAGPPAETATSGSGPIPNVGDGSRGTKSVAPPSLPSPTNPAHHDYIRTGKDGPKTPTAKPSELPWRDAVGSPRTGVPNVREGAPKPVPPRPPLKPEELTQVRFAERYRSGQLEHLTKGQVSQKLKLSEQYKYWNEGDVARRLQLYQHVQNITQITNIHNTTNVTVVKQVFGPDYRYYHGRITPAYAQTCFKYHYWGPSFFVGVHWYPRWHTWLEWCWHLRSHPLWDPRPIWCRPVIYDPSPRWVVWEVPVWVSLPEVPCGTWVNLRPVIVTQSYDLQLVAVRFVDPGHPEQKLGPRYRVWFRNNSDRPITKPFSVMLLASMDERLHADLPQAGVRVRAIEADDLQSVDIRLPMEVYSMGRDAQGNPAPFNTLHVLVDAHREIEDVSRANNGARLARAEVLPVDPAAFELNIKQAPAGSEVIIAGEGFGPVPGQVLVHLAGLELDAEILGWFDLGVRINLPKIPLAAPTEAELVVVRGDGAAANPLRMIVQPPR